MALEHVHVIWGWWDGPLEGIADFHGTPHVFECQFSEENDEWTDLYRLMEIEPALLKLAQEMSAIFQRWRTEWERGNTSIETHPALPADRSRYDELQEATAQGLKVRRSASILRRARFICEAVMDCRRVEWAEPDRPIHDP